MGMVPLNFLTKCRLCCRHPEDEEEEGECEPEDKEASSSSPTSTEKDILVSL